MKEIGDIMIIEIIWQVANRSLASKFFTNMNKAEEFKLKLLAAASVLGIDGESIIIRHKTHDLE